MTDPNGWPPGKWVVTGDALSPDGETGVFVPDDPNGWPAEARKKALLAAATRMRDACQWGGPPEDWLLDAARILDEDFEDLIATRVAEARFAPMGDNHHNAAACPYCNPELQKMLAEARNKALDEAAAVARRVPIPGECSPAEAHGRMTGALAAAEAIRALKEAPHDRRGPACH